MFFHSIHVNFALWISWLLDWNLRLKVVAWWKLLACNFCMGPLWLIVYILLKRRSSESPFQYGFQYSTKVLWCRRALAILSKKLFPRGLCQQCIGPHCSSHTWPKIAAMGTSSRWKAASSSFQANYLASLAYLASRISIHFTVCRCLSVVCCSYFVALRRNVHPERWMSLSDGQHQWGFDVDLGPSGSLTTLICTALHCIALHCTAANEWKWHVS